MTNISKNMDLTIKPIPARSPILPHSVVYLGGIVDISRPTFALLKNNVQILIEGPALNPDATDRPSYMEMDFTKLNMEYQRCLSIIENLIPSIEFGATNMAYLTQDGDGDYNIIQEQITLKHIPCPIWGPRIYVDEIQITVWGEGFERRRGLWNGKEVDIFYALNEFDRFELNRAMYILRHLDGTECDLTFEFYGHLMDRDGTILGFITEAACGRNIALGDEEFVLRSLQRLTNFGCLYRAVTTNQFLVSGGKLRLLRFPEIVYYSDQEQLKKDAEYNHKWALDELFEEFRNYGPYGHHQNPPLRLTLNPYDVKYLRMLPTPERPLDLNSMGLNPRFMWTLSFANVFGYDEKPLVARTTRRSQRKDFHLIYNRKDRQSVDGSAQDRAQLVYSRIKTRPSLHLRRTKILEELSSTEGTASILEGMADEVDSGLNVI